MSSPDAFADRVPISGTSTLLGRRVLGFDEATTRVRVGFDAKPDFRNPAGFIQGGMLTAMLDDSMGASIWLAVGGKAYPVTIDLNVSFLGAARPGPLVGEARVVQLGTTIAFMEAQLTDEGGRLIARATASVRLYKSDFTKETESGGGAA
jgi:uncharacterized protein (TIGR00369 family)